jgi:putative tryptophan/tyrosine transport system substrate-binding protein
LGQHEKRIELLHTVMPRLTRVGVIVNPLNTTYKDLADAMQETFRSRGLTLVRVDARGADEIDAAFAKMADERLAAIHVPDDVAVVGHGPSRQQIIELALARRLPVTSTYQPFAADGGLAAFGADIPALARRAAAYVDKILRGAAPAELPVERPTVLKLAVNLKTARALGLAIPPEILLRADEVIE